jgi:hypothetical protein
MGLNPYQLNNIEKFLKVKRGTDYYLTNLWPEYTEVRKVPGRYKLCYHDNSLIYRVCTVQDWSEDI